jgi:hypothetical protein
LIETLGVIPLDESQAVLQKDGPEATTVRLISERVSPSGQTVRKIIVVDACSGNVVEQLRRDASGSLIARAVFSDHQADPSTGIILPHQIELEWPEAEMALKMRVGHVEVNPAGMPEQTWQLPDIPGYPVLDLAQIVQPLHATGR